jgi:hypothetical protein
MAPSVLVVSFEDLPDPRVERTRVHHLGDVLVIAVLAVLAGADGWDDIVEWAEARQKWLRTFLSLKAGIPSADTVRRIFETIDPKKFLECFHRMVAHLAAHMPDQLIAIDGKTMRRTFSRSAGTGPLHVVIGSTQEHRDEAAPGRLGQRLPVHRARRGRTRTLLRSALARSRGGLVETRLLARHSVELPEEPGSPGE